LLAVHPKGKEESPLAITRSKKEELVATYQREIDRSSAIVFTNYTNISVAKINDLRAKLRAADTTFMVTKNTLMGLALKECGRTVDAESLLEGPSAVAFVGEDIGRGVKTLADWIKDAGGEIVQIKGAVLENDLLDSSRAAALADLPTRDQMLAILLATIIAPASQLVRTINEPAASLARVIKAHADKQEAA
jgi:large subunit ribosomal protein L10